MIKFNSFNIVEISKKNFSWLRIQDGILPFCEKPSDKLGNKGNCDKDNKDSKPFEKRITAVELFSHFTADIIKKEVIFTR